MDGELLDNQRSDTTSMYPRSLLGSVDESSPPQTNIDKNILRSIFESLLRKRARGASMGVQPAFLVRPRRTPGIANRANQTWTLADQSEHSSEVRNTWPLLRMIGATCGNARRKAGAFAAALA
jgi:hypothetical protein